jgi:hypothetical protein
MASRLWRPASERLIAASPDEEGARMVAMIVPLKKLAASCNLPRTTTNTTDHWAPNARPALPVC